MASFQESVGKVTILDQCPNDVLGLVISFLSIADVFTLRAVCKEWNEFITTRVFKENKQLGFKKLGFKKLELLAVCNVDSGSNSPEFKAYDVEAEKWHSFDLSFLPDYAGGLRVVDFSGGLACVMQNRSIETILYVCNPVTKRWARLPSSPTIFNMSSSFPDVIVRIYYWRKTGHYKVFMVSGLCANNSEMFWSYDRLVVEEFDSSSWSWAVYSQTCHPFRWTDVTGVSVIPCNNGNRASLFILLYKTLSHNQHRRELFALLFDEDKGGLVLVKIRAVLPSNLLNPTMVYCEQNHRPLLIVSAVGDRDGASGVEIWEFANRLTEWRNLATMPYDMFGYFKSLHCRGFGESRKFGGEKVGLLLMRPVTTRFIESFPPMIVVAVAADKHLLYMHPESMVTWTIAYDTITRSWLRLCRNIPPQLNATQFSSRITALSCVQELAFEPSLENVVSHEDRALEPSLENAVSHEDLDG